MQITKTIVDHSLHESFQHGTPGFPFAAYLDDFAQFENGYICWHWHSEIQFSVVILGTIEFRVSNQIFVLHEGDGIFINSGLLHQIRPMKSAYGAINSFLLKPEFIESDAFSDISKDFVQPVIHGSKECFVLNHTIEEDTAILKSLLLSRNIFDEGTPGFQLKIKSLICDIWYHMFCQSPIPIIEQSVQRKRDEQRVKEALDFVFHHYQEQIKLEDIAAAAMLSKSELCRCFGRILNMTPVEYLIQYRITEAKKQITAGVLTIAEISSGVGFASPSHFSMFFRKLVGCSPSEYRQHKNRS